MARRGWLPPLASCLARGLRWSAALLALAFLIIVATIDLPDLPAHLGKRLFWTLTVRELAFAAGALANEEALATSALREILNSFT